MIKFDKLFKILEERGISQYQLYQYNNFSRSKLQRFKNGGNVNVQSVNEMLDFLKDCKIEDICEYVPSDEEKED